MILFQHDQPTNHRQGISLIEVLVGLTITLVVLLAMTQAFKFASTQMASGRASVELVNRLRTAESLLRKDLDRLTVEAKPFYFAATEPKGYIEIVDGFATDTNWVAAARGVADTPALTNLTIQNNVIGDYDDIIAGTIRSDAQPFRGRNQVNIEESHLAEVIWFTVRNDLDDDAFISLDEGVRLFRRVLLVKPTLGPLQNDLSATDGSNLVLAPSGGTGFTYTSEVAAILDKNAFLRRNDVSVAVQQTSVSPNQWQVVPNSLESLAVRENRFFVATHGMIGGINPTNGNFNLNANQRRIAYRLGLREVKRSDYATEMAFNFDAAMTVRSTDNQNLLLNNVAAFDIQVFDPEGAVGFSLEAGRIQHIVGGSDAGFSTLGGLNGFMTEGTTAPPATLGDYVDLGKTFGFPTVGQFGGTGNALNFVDQVYDTGTPRYDRNNFDDDGDGLTDEGGDNIDNDANGLVDDEKEVVANFGQPLRGLRIRLRLIEPASGQVSQTTVKHSF